VLDFSVRQTLILVKYVAYAKFNDKKQVNT